MAQQGTQFLPPDTRGWPVAEISPALQSQMSYGEAPGSYSAIYRTQPSVYTVVEFLAWQLSQVGLKAYRRTSDTEREHLKSSALSDIIHDPAPGLTYQRLIHRTVADLCIYGNCYWLKLDAPANIAVPERARVLTPLPAGSVTPRGGTLIQADRYDVAIGAQPRTFAAEDVIHFRRYNPDDPRIGVSPLEPLRSVVNEEASSSAYRLKTWQKSARIDGVIERPADKPWDDTAAKRFREGWRRFTRGGSHEGETAVLEDGMQWKAASFSPKDAEFIEGRKLTLETVARAFNIPLSVLSLTETATYASQKEFHKALYQDTLGPWTRMIEDELDAALVPWFTSDPDVYVEFTIEEKLRGSFEEQAEAARNSVGVPYESVNERRAKNNQPRIDDPAFDVPVKPANVIYAGVPGRAPLPDAPAADANVVPIAERTRSSP